MIHLEDNSEEAHKWIEIQAKRNAPYNPPRQISDAISFLHAMHVGLQLDPIGAKAYGGEVLSCALGAILELAEEIGVTI